MTNYWMWIYYNEENIHELYEYLALDIKNITLQKKESDNNKRRKLTKQTDRREQNLLTIIEVIFFKKIIKLDQLNMYYFYLRNSIIIALNYMLINMNIFCNSF